MRGLVRNHFFGWKCLRLCLKVELPQTNLEEQQATEERRFWRKRECQNVSMHLALSLSAVTPGPLIT
jgi:hypothetical protein